MNKSVSMIAVNLVFIKFCTFYSVFPNNNFLGLLSYPKYKYKTH